MHLALPFFIKTKGFPDLQGHLFDVSNSHDVETESFNLHFGAPPLCL
jgi:hypothetical protein